MICTVLAENLDFTREKVQNMKFFESVFLFDSSIDIPNMSTMTPFKTLLSRILDLLRGFRIINLGDFGYIVADKVDYLGLDGETFLILPYWSLSNDESTQDMFVTHCVAV